MDIITYAATLFSPKDLEYLTGIEISVIGKLIDAMRDSVYLKHTVSANQK